ncbi:MAG: hypothetical protein JKY71_01305 [Alphaproteobacteria bacterium]|nr:hypothetical protein [Alphaproteobacteria bacterium]
MTQDWIQKRDALKEHGLVPYVCTSELFLDHLDLDILGPDTIVATAENAKDLSFHKAYVLANALGFQNPDVQMPHWVYLDLVLLQTAVVGFALEKSRAPEELASHFKNDPKIVYDALTHIPFTGQTSGLGIDHESLMGFSLFSLRRYMKGLKFPALGGITKEASLRALKADQDDKVFYGLTQYDNAAVPIHAGFANRMYVQKPRMLIHPLGDMSFMYKMDIDFDATIEENEEPNWKTIAATDVEAKIEMERLQKEEGASFYICHPYRILRDGEIYVPLSREK